MKDFIKKFIPPFLLNWYHLSLPALGAFIYGFPSKKLKVIGITGTNGKSTVVDLTARILEEAGYRVASISSIRFKIGEKEWPNTLKMTMPGRLVIQKFLKQALKAECHYAVLEVTSEGIKQHRHKFIDFDVALITNLSPEHLESHGSFEEYKKTKGEFFRTLTKYKKSDSQTLKKSKKISIVNGDDPNADYFLQFLSDEKWVYGIETGNHNLKVFAPKYQANPIREQTSNRMSENKNLKFIKIRDPKLLAGGSRFVINNVEFNLKLLGKFNIYNTLAAICVGLSQGIELEICKKALEKIGGIPGRMEIVETKPFTIIVDYAHTPNALEEVYYTIQNQLLRLPSQHLICILGAAGGGRDKWKRPEFGKIASKYCDKIIVTNEDPYHENPQTIIEQIFQGIDESKLESSLKIVDRREAIKKALNLCRPKDVLIITGKGCEPWMMVNGTKIPWDDREIVKEELKNL